MSERAMLSGWAQRPDYATNATAETEARTILALTESFGNGAGAYDRAPYGSVYVFDAEATVALADALARFVAEPIQ